MCHLEVTPNECRDEKSVSLQYHHPFCRNWTWGIQTFQPAKGCDLIALTSFIRLSNKTKHVSSSCFAQGAIAPKTLLGRTLLNARNFKSQITLESFSLGDADDVDHLVPGENGVDGQLLLEVLAGVVDLLSDGAPVDLDLHDVGLLLPPPQKLLLGVADHPHHLAVLLDLAEVLLDLLLAEIVLPLEGRLSKSLLLRLGPSGFLSFSIFVRFTHPPQPSPLQLHLNKKIGHERGTQSTHSAGREGFEGEKKNWNIGLSCIRARLFHQFLLEEERAETI